VLEVVSDRKLGQLLYSYSAVASGTHVYNAQSNEYIYVGTGGNFNQSGSTTEVNYDLYLPEVMSYSDYYPFGMEMEGRSNSSNGTRHGFNGMEKISEYTDNNSHYDFGARIYDARIGRWLSTDPLSKKYPSLSPYHSLGNNPILVIDMDGKENTIYLVPIQNPKDQPNLINVKVDYKKIAEEANQMFEKLGVETRVKVWEGTSADFNENYLDATDGKAYIGNPMMMNEILAEHNISFKFSGNSSGGRLETIDLSPQGTANLITLSTMDAEEYASKLGGVTNEKALAWGLVHGAAHNSIAAHPYNLDATTNFSSDGTEVIQNIEKGLLTLDDMLSRERTTKTAEQMNKHYGGKKSVDNYKRNKKVVDLATKMVSDAIKSVSSDKTSPAKK